MNHLGNIEIDLDSFEKNNKEFIKRSILEIQ